MPRQWKIKKAPSGEILMAFLFYEEIMKDILAICNELTTNYYDTHTYEHALRVASVMLSESTEAYAVALLHDIVEDTDCTLDDLRQAGLPEEVVEAVDAITRRDGEIYLKEYIPRVKRNEIARKVKRADLDENMSPNRLKVGYFPNEEVVRQMRRRYERAVALLDA
jgi:hypothetical protein